MKTRFRVLKVERNRDQIELLQADDDFDIIKDTLEEAISWIEDRTSGFSMYEYTIIQTYFA